MLALEARSLRHPHDRHRRRRFLGDGAGVNLLQASRMFRPACCRSSAAAASAKALHMPRGLSLPAQCHAGRISAQSMDPHASCVSFSFPGATAEDFLPRALYGKYLATILRAAQRRRPATSAWAPQGIGGGVAVGAQRARVRLRDGRRYAADDAVATGYRERWHCTMQA